MNLNSIKDEIRELTRIGYKPLPCRVTLHEGKKLPYFGHGFGWLDRIGPEYLVQRLQALDDEPNGLVVLTGDDLLVVDLDRKPGLDPDGALRRAGIELPQHTPRARTPQGEHYYLRMPHGVSGTHAGLYDGIDTRGAGGFVYAPPTSIKGYGVYSWIVGPDVPLADAPAALVDALRQREDTTTTGTTYTGRKHLDDLTPRQRAILDERLQQARDEGLREPGPGRDRSRYDYRLICWCIDCGLAVDEICRLVQNVGKFDGRGDEYFKGTFYSALRRKQNR